MRLSSGITEISAGPMQRRACSLIVSLALVSVVTLIHEPTLASSYDSVAEREMFEAKVSDATTHFGLSLMKAISQSETDASTTPATSGDQQQEQGNTVVSPLSLQVLLNTILLGAKDQSLSQAELAKVLGYGQEAGGAELSLKAGDEEDANATGVRLGRPHKAMQSVVESIMKATRFSLSDRYLVNFTLANMMLANKDRVETSPEYEADLKKYYNMTVEQFSRQQDGQGEQLKLHERVNYWVRNITQNQITDLADEASLSDERLLLVLLNAAHFKGRWLQPFNSDLTQDGVFYNNGRRSAGVETKFMRQKGMFGYAEINSLDCSALSLPFSPNDGKDMSMVLLLPNKPEELNSLIASLTAEALNELYRSLSEQQVQVELPKFSIEASHNVKAMLGQLGLTSIFGGSAELDRMFAANKPNSDASVDKIIHKAKITVDELGAQAAAASMATVVTRSLLTISPSFIANHPFLYIIRHNRSNMPLFMGVVNRF